MRIHELDFGRESHDCTRLNMDRKAEVSRLRVSRHIEAKACISC